MAVTKFSTVYQRIGIGWRDKFARLGCVVSPACNEYYKTKTEVKCVPKKMKIGVRHNLRKYLCGLWILWPGTYSSFFLFKNILFFSREIAHKVESQPPATHRFSLYQTWRILSPVIATWNSRMYVGWNFPIVLKMLLIIKILSLQSL